jgi:hypothetical protein
LKERTAKYVAIVGLSFAGIMGVVIFTSPYEIWNFRPSHDLGHKDVLISDLRQYLGREDETAVLLANEQQRGNGTLQLFRYDLISVKDQKEHGNILFVVRNNSVMSVGVDWRYGNDTVLQESGDLILSAVADITIPDWQSEDRQPYRNIEILKVTNAQPVSQYYDNYNLEQDRYLRFVKFEDGYKLDLFIEPAF